MESKLHLPKNYRVVKDGLEQYWVQKKFLFMWWDWKYYWGYERYAPKFFSKEEACKKALSEIRKREAIYQNAVKANQITVIGDC